MTTSQLAKKASVNLETVRYYERRGLIPEPPRTESGYRDYSQDIIARILFIKRAQDLGFTLKEISELLSLRVDPDTTCCDVRQRTETKIRDVDEKISDLQRIREALTVLVQSCKGKGPTSACPILEAIDTKETSHANH